MCKEKYLFGCIVLFLSLDQNVQARSRPLSEATNNFTLEILFHTMTNVEENANLILSPITIWGLLLDLSKASNGITRQEISIAIRAKSSDNSFSTIQQFFERSPTFEIQKLNAIFADSDILPLRDFISTSLEGGVHFLPINLTDTDQLNRQLNAFKLQYPKLKLFNPNDITLMTLLPVTAVTLNGDWKFRFDTMFTTKQPFYDTNGKYMGHVNMMYNRDAYIVTEIDELKAKVIEIPYDREQFSMIILLPNAGVSLKDVLRGFLTASFNIIFRALDRVKIMQTFVTVIPRFHISSNLDMKFGLNLLGIYSLFSSRAEMPYVARTPTYVDKFLHNVDIDVTEKGSRVSDSMNSVLGTRVGVASFVANRPFLYFIVEKTTKSIVFCGKYEVPVLY